MKKRIVSLLLAAAMLVLLAVPAFAEDGHAYTYVALGDSITTGVGLKDTHFSSTAKSYDVQENYHDYSKDCYVARVADALGLDRDHAVNYGMPAAMSSNILDLVRTGSTASGSAYYDLPTLRQELADADLITLLIGSNDTVLQLMGAMGRATNGKATKLLIPLLTGTMRELNLQNLRTLRKGLENLDLTPEELKAALKLLDSGMEEICDQTRDQTVANVEQILQELRALNPDAQIILVGYYNPLPFLPTYGRHFRLLNRSVKALAQQYGADYVSIPYTSIANDGHPTVCGHKYIARQILKALAAYAGSAIAKSNPMKTGINATKLAIAAFIVPFIFAYNPQMLFENVTSVFQVIQIVITALLGIFAVAAGLEGYILRTMHWPLRVLAVIGGLTLLIPGTVSDLIGLVIVAGIIALQIVQNKKAARETA